MDERENLPAKLAAQGLAATTEKHGGLVARGMAVLRKDNDALYRQARAVFDRGDGIRNWIAVGDPAIFSAFKIFHRLADENYGKAYYPLSILYSGGNDIEDGDSRARHYTQLALEWCLANQANDDAELWCDLADMHNTNGFKDNGVTQSNEIAEVWYRKAAEKGYARGQWELGSLFCFCAEGHSDHSDRSAYNWMELAAYQGNAFYQICLAEYYEIFRWGELSESQQYQKAAYWYRMAAEQGDGCGQFNLGRMYEKGLGVEQDDEQFVYWTRKAAEQGYELGQWELGRMYSEGRGVAQVNKQAEYWYRKAAEQGDEERQKELGYMYSEGRGVAQNYEQAEYWFSKADWPPYEIGSKYYFDVPPNDGQVVYWFRKAAEQGDEYGQWELGEMFANGRGVAQDNEQAEYWFRKAAEQVDSSYQNELGEMYKEGRGVSQDDKQAVYWFTKAAEQGDEEGQFNLGLMYEDGRGVAQDNGQAVYWFRKAAEQGHRLSQLIIADMHDDSEGLLDEYHNLGRSCYGDRNYEQAMYWYRKAAERGHFLSQLFLAEMYEDGRGIKDDEQAVYWFRKALETFPGSGDAQGGLERLGIDWKKK